MSNIAHVILCSTVLIAMGCGSDQAHWDTKEEAIIARHDEVMPLMETYIKRRSVLRGALPSSDTLWQVHADSAIRLTRAADEAMMEWMYQYRRVASLQDSLSSDEIEAYLIYQRQGIEEVATLMMYADTYSARVVEQRK